jgi:hypothetical protein
VLAFLSELLAVSTHGRDKSDMTSFSRGPSAAVSFRGRRKLEPWFTQMPRLARVIRKPMNTGTTKQFATSCTADAVLAGKPSAIKRSLATTIKSATRSIVRWFPGVIPVGYAFGMGCLIAAPHATAQAFSSGSNGSYGPMRITKDTGLQLPPDGIFHCTTITISSGATLSFTKNALNTPVYLLATGDVVINGVINVAGFPPGQALFGVGGPGGFDGGAPAHNVEEPGGSGHGPGGGPWFGGMASYGTVGYEVVRAGLTYGSATLVPMIGGSGGGGGKGNPGIGGGGGGGALLIASTTKIVMTNGLIWAVGGFGPSSRDGEWGGAGSGGAVRFVSPVVKGRGTIDASGGGTANWGGRGGGGGRVRIDSLERTEWDFDVRGKFSMGSQMVVFPSTIPRLDIVKAAGQDIVVGSQSGVTVNLPRTAPAEQTITVRARDFTGSVPIVVSVVPDSGPSLSYPATIDMSTNPAEVLVNVTLSVGIICHIYAWTGQ